MMILAAGILSLFVLQAQDEKKATPEPPAQEKPAPKDAPQDKKEPQDEKKSQDDKKPAEEKPVPKELAEDEPGDFDLTADLRLGGWWMGKFDALTTAGRRRIDSTLLFDAGIDLQAELSGWTLTLSGDYGTGKHVKMEAGGLLFGYKFIMDDHDPVFDLHLAVGPIFGRLDTDVTGFG